MAPIVPYIPETITVHLGAPDAGAENVTVSFSDYVKNVLSSEVYPTWEPAALPGQRAGRHLVRAQPRLYGVLPQPRLSLRHHVLDRDRSEIHQRPQHL